MLDLMLLMFFILLLLSGKIIENMKNISERQFKSDYLKYGFLSRYYLSRNLSPAKFEDFCKYILNNMGYQDLMNISEFLEGGINLCSVNNKSYTYISTRLYGLKGNEEGNVNDNYETIGRPELQKFIGALVHNKVKKGIIMTTGNFTEDAIEYAESLPGEYSITLMDGIALTKELRKIRRKEITERISCNAAG